jgi:hypothetical protein
VTRCGARTVLGVGETPCNSSCARSLAKVATACSSDTATLHACGAGALEHGRLGEHVGHDVEPVAAVDDPRSVAKRSTCDTVRREDGVRSRGNPMQFKLYTCDPLLPWRASGRNLNCMGFPRLLTPSSRRTVIGTARGRATIMRAQSRRGRGGGRPAIRR